MGIRSCRGAWTLLFVLCTTLLGCTSPTSTAHEPLDASSDGRVGHDAAAPDAPRDAEHDEPGDDASHEPMEAGSRSSDAATDAGLDAQAPDADTSFDAGVEAGVEADASLDAGSDRDSSAGEPDGGEPDAGEPEEDKSIVMVDEPPLELEGLAAKDLFPGESAERELYELATITLRGQVIDDTGQPLAGVTVAIDNAPIGITNTEGGFDTHTALTNDEGAFTFFGLARKNRLIEVSKTGHRTIVRPVHLFEPRSVGEVEVPPIILPPREDDVARFLFGGDLSWARHFMDADDDTPPGELPPDDPDAFLLASDPLPGARNTLKFVKPLFLSTDFPTVNLETSVTDNPLTPHPTKDYIFYTLPGALPALKELGVTFVTIGNNHVYDYLEQGMADTVYFLDEAGIGYSGGGVTAEDAFAPYRREIAGHKYSFIGATSVRGEKSLPLYVAADDPPPPKGGAADAADEEQLQTMILVERALGRLPIVQLHTGIEYTFTPGTEARGYMSLAATSGAALVIAHHPHTAQGFGREEGVLIAHSLGNFCFDQDRLETFMAVLAQVDMRGEEVEEARAIPVYLEDYRPRQVTGDLARSLIRRIGEVSYADDVTLAQDGSEGFVAPPGDLGLTRDSREIEIPVTIPSSGFAVLDLRSKLAEGESVVVAYSDAPGLTGQLGEDLLVFGDFEDWDVDEDVLEVPRWQMDGSKARYPCIKEPYRGNVAACSRRIQSSTGVSTVGFDSRVRYLLNKSLKPNKDVTIVGYTRGDNAGKVDLRVSYEASSGDKAFCAPGILCGCTQVNVDCNPDEDIDTFQTVLTFPAGTQPWTQFAVDLAEYPDTIPSSSNNDDDNTRSVRLKFEHSKPSSGTGIARYDDIAVVSWRAALSLSVGLDAEAPNPVDFIRVEGPEGTYPVKVTIERIAVAPP